MIINSDFKDYYDSMQKHGVDKTVVYNRREEPITERGSFPRLLRISDMFSWYRGEFGTASISPKLLGTNHDFNMILLGYCGSFKFFFQATRRLRHYDGIGPVKKIGYAPSWPLLGDLDQVIAYVDGMDRAYRDLFYSRYDKKSGKIYFQRDSVAKAFDIAARIDPGPVFQEVRAPLILILGVVAHYEPTIVVNPNLQQRGLTAVAAPNQIYQDISMYISGVLGSPTRATLEVSDEIKVAKHGFDTHSFRKAPEQRK